MTLGQKLRFFRTAQGKTQREVACMLSMERSTYTYYELDKTLPSIQVVRRLAKMHGVTVDFLTDETVTPFGAEEFLLLDANRRSKREKSA